MSESSPSEIIEKALGSLPAVDPAVLEQRKAEIRSTCSTVFKHLAENYAEKIPSFKIVWSLPQLFLMRDALARENFKTDFIVVGSETWANIISDPNISNYIDPITRYDYALEGELGTIMGMRILTEAFYEPSARLLPANVLAVVSTSYKGDVTRFEAALVK